MLCRRAPLLVLFGSALATACGLDAVREDVAAIAASEHAQTTAPISPSLRAKLAAGYLPDPTRGGKSPWGGADPSGWQPEAIAANAASARINAAWADPDVADVLVAIPAKLVDSGFRPYGDGQTNSAPTFPFWGAKRPPLVATLTYTKSGGARVVFELDGALALSQSALEIAYESVTTHEKKQFVVAATAKDGGLVASWTPDAALGWNDPGQVTPVFVRPSPGYADWFPVYFRMPRHTVADFVASVPAHMRTMPGDGKPVLDSEGLKGNGPGTPLARALAHDFPAHRWNVGQRDASGRPLPYVPANVHAELGAGGRPTAVGRGFTWVAENDAPFKIMYTGFDGRDEPAEAQHGVPSGSGWHVMGDTITLINHEEDVPMLAGAGFSDPAIRFGITPPSGAYSYALSDVLVFRLLLPGEAFVTVPTLFPTRDQDHQWYAIPVGPRERGFLAEEWVSPTRPSGNNPKFQ